MKKAFLAATAAAVAFVMASSAQAAVMDPIDSVALNTVDTDSFNAVSVSGFVEYFDFYLTEQFAVSVGGYSSAFNSVKFTDLLIADWNGVDAFNTLSYTTLSPSITPNGKFLDALFLTGPGTFVLKFVGTGSGSFGGDISIAAVPEPATWAMMIAGIAAVGTAMRRRSVARVSFS